MAGSFSTVDYPARDAHRRGISVFQCGYGEIQIIRLRNAVVRASIQDSTARASHCGASGDGQRTDLLSSPLAWPTDACGYGTVARHDLDYSNRFSRHLARTRSLGIGPRFPFNAWTGTILDRLPHRPIPGEAPLIELKVFIFRLLGWNRQIK